MVIYSALSITGNHYYDRKQINPQQSEKEESYSVRSCHFVSYQKRSKKSFMNATRVQFAIA